MKTRERVAAALLALVTAGFAGYSIGTTPGSAASPASSDWTVRQAEDHAVVVLHRLAPSCAADGKAAEAWAEANSQMPHGFEVIGQCAGRLP